MQPSKDELDKYDIELEFIRERCWQRKRKAPERSQCGFCRRVFEDESLGEGKGWEERMEHIGRHYEKVDLDISQEEVDCDLRDWAVAEGIMRRLEMDNKWYLTGFEPVESGTRRGRMRRSRGSEAKATILKAEASDGSAGRDNDEDAEGEEE